MIILEQPLMGQREDPGADPPEFYKVVGRVFRRSRVADRGLHGSLADYREVGPTPVMHLSLFSTTWQIRHLDEVRPEVNPIGHLFRDVVPGRWLYWTRGVLT